MRPEHTELAGQTLHRGPLYGYRCPADRTLGKNEEARVQWQSPMWVPNMKGNRESAVLVEASRGKPGSGGSNRLRHLPGNPASNASSACIVCFSFLTQGQKAKLPTYAFFQADLTLAEGPTLSSSWSRCPHLPRGVRQPYFKKADPSASLPCSDARVCRHQERLGLRPTSPFTYLQIPADSCFLAGKTGTKEPRLPGQVSHM